MTKMKQIMTERMIRKWIKENKEFLNDYYKLCEELLCFKVKWGIEIGFIFKNLEEIKGRKLGVGAIKEIEELFDAQKITNKKVAEY